MPVETWAQFVDALPSYALRIGAAFACGAAIGVERESKSKPAGLRTMALIAVGSSLFAVVSQLLPGLAAWPRDVTQVDPSRIASYVAAGIGFLGAGTIIQQRDAVHGLTTAATVWVAAALGICAGFGHIFLAMAVTVLVLVALVALDPLDTWLVRSGRRMDLRVTAPDDSVSLALLRHLLAAHDVSWSQVQIRPVGDGRVELAFTYLVKGGNGLRLLQALARMDRVAGVPQG